MAPPDGSLTPLAVRLLLKGRVPLTADAELWEQAVRLGRRVLWLHTYGERFIDAADNRPAGPPRAAAADRPKVQVAIPGTVDDMPDDISYDTQSATLHVGAGRIAPVRPEVWAYEVSGMRIINKWFGYRKKNPAGRRSSPLDDIHLDRWPADYTTDLLQLLNMLTLCVELEPAQAQLLAQVSTGRLVTVADLEHPRVFPVPAAVRKPPTPEEPDQPGLI